MAECTPTFLFRVCDGIDGISSTHRCWVKVQRIHFMSECDILLIITSPNRYFWWLNLTEQSVDTESQGSQHNETFWFQRGKKSKSHNAFTHKSVLGFQNNSPVTFSTSSTSAFKRWLVCWF